MKIKKNGGVPVEAVVPLPLLRRTQHIISLTQKAEAQKQDISQPINQYVKIIKGFIEEKEFQFSSAGEFQIFKENKQISFDQLSSGEKQLPILLTETLLQKGEPFVFLADEPEISLHIEWQAKIVSSIKELNQKAQVIVATYSVEMIEERYEWLWLYAATRPQTGRVFWLVLPRLDAECVQAFLDEFARAHATEGRRLLLAWDGAPAHRAATLAVSERVSLLSVPAYTPELNPAERVWPLVKEGVADRAHEGLDALEQKVCARCQKISAAEVSARTKYHWWPGL